MPSPVPLFRSGLQAKLLAALFLRPEQNWTLAALARELGTTSSTLHREVRLLEESGLITATPVGRARILAPNTTHPIAEPLLRILSHVYGPEAVLSEEFGTVPGVQLLLIFGSWAARQGGEPGPPPNDVDVLVVGEADRTAVYAAADRAQERVGLPVNPVLASHRRWEAASDALIQQIKSGPFIELASDDGKDEP